MLNPSYRSSFPYFSIQIADEVFTIASSNLISFTFTLGETRKSSSCQFEILDLDGKLAEKFFSSSYATAGVDVPSEFFQDPNLKTDLNPRANSSNSTALDTSGVGGTLSTGGEFTPQLRAYMDLIAYKEVGDTLGLTGYYENNQTSLGHFTQADIDSGGGFPASAGTGQNVGRYQMSRNEYIEARKADPRITSYTPRDQDLLCLYKLKIKGAYSQILSGNIAGAISASNTEWVSLPGGSQVVGSYSTSQAIVYYNQRVAVYSAAASTANQSSSPSTNLPISTINDSTVLTLIKSNATVSRYIGNIKTASGEVFDVNALTCAHANLPFNSQVKVTYAANAVTFRVNDRDSLGSDLSITDAGMIALGASQQASIIATKLELVNSANAATVQSNTKSQAKQSAADSIQKAKTPPSDLPSGEISAAGTQITIQVSFDPNTILAFTFIHTGTNYKQPVERILTFQGQSVRWVMNRTLKSTKYTNTTLKGLATLICKNYGLTLKMVDEGGMIKVASQTGHTDLKFLSDICDRSGYAIHDYGKIIEIKKRAFFNSDPKMPIGFVLDIGQNLISLNITDKAQTNASGSNDQIIVEKGIQTTVVDPDSGSMKKVAKDNSTQAVLNPTIKFSTGKIIPELIIPIQNKQGLINIYERPQGKPIKEYTLNAVFLTNQSALELITPDTPFYISGSIPFVNKAWYVESVNHSFSNGTMITNVSAYIPVAVKAQSSSANASNPRTNISSGTGNAASPSGVGVISAYQILSSQDSSQVLKFEDLHVHHPGAYLSYLGRSGQNGGIISVINGITPQKMVYDFVLSLNGNQSCKVPSPISGQVTSIGGANNDIILNGEGTTVRILHQSSHFNLVAGSPVVFGQPIGIQGSVGQSTGTHTHVEIEESFLRRWITTLLSGQFVSGVQ